MALFYNTMSVVVVVGLAAPYVLIGLPFVIVAAVYFYRQSIGSYRETTRVQSVVKSPVLSFVSESISGTSTIRAFKKEKDFLKHCNSLLNQNIVAGLWASGVGNNFSLRIDLISCFVLTISTCFILIARHDIDPVYLSLMLTYILIL